MQSGAEATYFPCNGLARESVGLSGLRPTNLMPQNRDYMERSACTNKFRYEFAWAEWIGLNAFDMQCSFYEELQ